MDELIFTVTAEHADMRIDAYIAAATADGEVSLSRSAAARLCEDGKARINGKIANKKDKLTAGDVVTLELPEPEPYEVEPENIPLDVVYEDADIIVINKPKGMVVHPAAGNATGTLVSALLYHCGDSLSGIGGVTRPGIVHRIDKDTTGLLVVAKNDFAHASLSEQIKEHSAFRTYIALVIGKPREESGTVDAPIGRHPVDRKKMAVVRNASAREAVTHWRTLEEFDGVSLVECRLETGRTHQIRVHMAHIGHPVLGDEVYGGSRHPSALRHSSLIDGQCLHAARLELTHPRTRERMTFTAPLPEKTEKLLAILRRG
jgi:23S rRNA pseudouridine1911/1915/1917 synthase